MANRDNPECRFVGEFNCAQTPKEDGSVEPLLSNGHPTMTYGADAGRIQAGFSTSVVSTEEEEKRALMVIGTGLVILTGGVALIELGGVETIGALVTEGAAIANAAAVTRTGMGISELTVKTAGVAGAIWGPPGPSTSSAENTATILSRLVEMGF